MRLDRILKKLKTDFVFACYGMNAGLALPEVEQQCADIEMEFKK
ncbi:hypothetical protein FEM08_11660 [Flavobacterium gilvum]|nr:hypothetical protein FEM08_11660 [Flavobacterium gilvum]